MIQFLRTHVTHRNTLIAGLVLVAAGLPLSPFLMSLGQIVLLLNWLAEGNYRSRLNCIFRNKLAVAVLLIFIIHLIGLLYTENFSYALNDIKIKLPLLIIPLVIAGSPLLRKKDIDLINTCFILALLSGTLVCLWAYFFSDRVTDDPRSISIIISHIRFSLMLCLGIFILLYYLFRMPGSLFSLKKSGMIILALWFFVFMGILGARSGFLAFFSILLLIAIYQVIRTRRWVLSVFMLLFILASPVLLYYSVGSFKTRIDEMVKEYEVIKEGSDPSGHSIAQRMVYWKAAVSFIRQSPFIGIGTGDINDAYLNYYATHPGELEQKYYLRAHNQFLTVAIAFGFLGLLIFLISLVYPLFRALKISNYFYLVFFCIILLSMMTEDTLETQAGATFFAFFTGLYLLGSPFTYASAEADSR